MSSCVSDIDWESTKNKGLEFHINLTALKDIDTWFDDKIQQETEWVYECGHPLNKEKGYVVEPYCPVCGAVLIEVEKE